LKNFKFTSVALIAAIVGTGFVASANATTIRVTNHAAVVAYADIPTCDGKSDARDIFITETVEFKRDCDVQHAWIGWRGDLGRGIWPCQNFDIKKDSGTLTYKVEYGDTPFRLYCNVTKA